MKKLRPPAPAPGETIVAVASDAPASESPDAFRGPSLGIAALVGSAGWLLHFVIGWLYPMPSTFLKYTEAARLLRQGALPNERLMDFSPLYLWIAQLVERASPEPAGWLERLHLVWIACAVGGLWWLLARRVSPWLAAVVALAFAVDRHLVVYARVLEPEILLLACTVGLLVMTDARRALPAGLLGALGVATRPTLLPLVVLLPFALSWGAPEAGSGARRRPRLGVWVAAWAPTALVLAVLAVRAFVATGDARAPSMNPGTVFFEGNHALSIGTSANYPPVVSLGVPHRRDEPDPAHDLYRDVARASVDDERRSSLEPALGPRRVNAYWSGLAAASLREHADAAAGRWLGKLRRALHGYRWHDVPRVEPLDRALRVPFVPFALAAALALVGMLAVARRWREHLLVYGLFASQLAVMTVFYVSARQRILLLPAVYLFAALSLAIGRRTIGTRRWLVAGLVALLALAFSLPGDPQRDDTYRKRGVAKADEAFGELARSLGDRTLVRGPQEAVTALAHIPWRLDELQPAFFPREVDPLELLVVEEIEARDLSLSEERLAQSARFDTGVLRLRLGDLDGARRRLEPLAEAGWTAYRGTRAPSDPRILLARIDALENRPEVALERLEAVLADRPGDAFALAEWVAIGSHTGSDTAAAIQTAAEEELRRSWSALDAAWFLGRAYLAHGRSVDAARVLEPLAERLPDAVEARKTWAVALGESGQVDQAISVLRSALADAEEPLVEPERTAAIVDAWVDAAPAERRIEGAWLLALHGFPTRAQRLLREAPPDMDGTSMTARDRRILARLLGLFEEAGFVTRPAGYAGVESDATRLGAPQEFVELELEPDL